jgi:hypothetical protein
VNFVFSTTRSSRADLTDGRGGQPAGAVGPGTGVVCGNRATVCAGLLGFGIELGALRNGGLRGERRISRDGAAVTVLVLAPEGDTIVVRAVARLLGLV